MTRRAKASYTKRYSHAELRTPDGTVSAQIKLFANGDFLVVFYEQGGRVPVAYRRQLSRKLKYDD